MTQQPVALAAGVVAFWREAGEEKWFAKDDGFDAAIRARFLDLARAAREGACAHWTADWEQAFAQMLLLDQFPRNMFRGSAEAFASDARAIDLARECLARGLVLDAPKELQFFFYLPFTHSENISDQAMCVALSRWRGDEETLRFAIIHYDIIARFGRFPHRNAALGRVTTPEERTFLDQPDSFKG